MVTLTRSLAQAWAKHRIRVNGVALGLTLPPPDMRAERFQELQAGAPLGRGPTAEEAAAAVRYLVEARSVTGETLIVDGGEHMGRPTPGAI